MLPLTLRRKITALALATALAVPCASFAATGQPTTGPGLLQQIWSALTGFWDGGVTPDDGCRMDPDGRCAAGAALSSAALSTPDSGCKMDPSGGGCATVTRDDGCRMDPSGGCLPGI